MLSLRITMVPEVGVTPGGVMQTVSPICCSLCGIKQPCSQGSGVFRHPGSRGLIMSASTNRDSWGDWESFSVNCAGSLWCEWFGGVRLKNATFIKTYWLILGICYCTYENIFFRESICVFWCCVGQTNIQQKRISLAFFSTVAIPGPV